LNNIEKGKSYCPTTMIEILIKRCLTLLWDFYTECNINQMK
jgi:hypothetical protein